MNAFYKIEHMFKLLITTFYSTVLNNTMKV
jgi:hypothetical protein